MNNLLIHLVNINLIILYDETSFYFKICGEQTCPHGYTHKQDNFIVTYNPETTKIMYICLSSDIYVILLFVKMILHLWIVYLIKNGLMMIC